MNVGTSRLVLVLFGCLVAGGVGVAACNSHPVEFRQAGGAVERLDTVSAGGGGKLDILFVIDNSGSMCQEQKGLRENFAQFIEDIGGSAANFNIGVTTTHFSASNFENVAQPGELQSTPHPPTFFDDVCKFEEDDQGNRDFEILKNQISAAVDCTKNPEQFSDLKNPDQSDLQCVADDDCTDVELVELFPCFNAKGSECTSREDFADVYREVPRGGGNVLRSRDYESGGELETDELQRDFACMSFVGTRGSPLEQGLKAAARAVSPVKTGGPVGNPYTQEESVQDRLNNAEIQINGEEAPNHGLFRSDAQTALLFVTDENDCSSPTAQGSDRTKVREEFSNSCTELNCYFPTSDEYSGEQLLNRVPNLYNRFRENLKDSRRLESLSEDDLVVASINGFAQSYSGEIPDNCSREQRRNLLDSLTVCNNDLGKARSGSRYGEFLSEVQSDNFDVVPGSPTDQGTGLICNPDGDLAGPLETIAEEFEVQTSACIERRVLPCNTSADSPECPEFEFGTASGDICQQWGAGTGEPDGFCSAAIRLRITPTGDRPLGELRSGDRDTFEELCIEESIGIDGSANTCVVKRDKFEWNPCEGNDDAIQLDWSIADAQRRLGPFEVRAQFAQATDTVLDQEEGADAGGAEAGSP